MGRSNYSYPGYERSGLRYWGKKALLYGGITFGALWFVAPLWWTLTTALASDPGAGFVVVFPESPTLDNFRNLFEQVPIGRWFLNTLFFAGAVTLFNLVFDTLAGYAFAKLEFFARDEVFLLFISTMMVPGMVTVIPVYIILVELGLIDTYTGLILPLIASPFGIFLLRQHFLGMPESLGEAARMDGCNELQTFYYIYLPLAKPAVAALAIFTFMGAWNNFEWPLIILDSEELFTLPYAIFEVQSEYSREWGLVMACALLMVVPVIAVFIAAQRHFIQGMTLSGLKQ